MRRLRPIVRLLLISAIGAALARGDAALAQDKAPALSAEDRQFLYWASESALADAALSGLAREKAESAAVKAFAARAEAEENGSHAALARMMSTAGVAPPRQADKEDRELHDNIAATSGATFDRLVMQTLIADIRKTIDLYDQQATAGQNPALLGFVAEALPRLRQLDQQARSADLALRGTAPLMSTSGTVATHQPAPGPM